MSIHIKAVGEGLPIIILHGWSLDHRTMMNSLEPVFHNKDGYKRVYIDLPGMGGSQSFESIQNSDDMLKEVLKSVDQIVGDQPFLLCGYSYGGYMTRGIAHFRKGLVRGILLLAPMTIADYNERSLPDHQILKKDPDLMSRLSPEEAGEFEPMAVVQGEREWDRFHKEILIPSRDANAQLMGRVREKGYGFSFDLDSTPFEYPALMITGRQDSSVGYQDAWRLMDQYPRATFAALDMAGHNLQIEQPDLFEALAANWLERVEIELEKKRDRKPF